MNEMIMRALLADGRLKHLIICYTGHPKFSIYAITNILENGGNIGFSDGGTATWNDLKAIYFDVRTA